MIASALDLFSAYGQITREHRVAWPTLASSGGAMKSRFQTTVLMGCSVFCGAVALGDDRPAAIEPFLRVQDQMGAVTHAVLVQRDGSTVFEHYGPDFGPGTPGQLYSVSKSVLALGVVAAVERSLLQLGDSVCRWLDASVNPDVCGVRVIDLLTMSSGLEWAEGPSGVALDSDATELMFGAGATDTVRFVMTRRIAHKPGTVFNYSTGDSALLAAVLKKAVGGRIREFFQNSIFEKIGIRNPVWEEDRAGNLIGGASLFLTAPDLAKIGQMMLRTGVGTLGRVVREDSVRMILSASSMSKPLAYGLHWWLNAPDPNREASPDNPYLSASATSKTFAALGHWGQALVVVPEENLVIVRIADDKQDPFDLDGLVARVRGIEVQGSSRDARDGPESSHSGGFASLVGARRFDGTLPIIDQILGFGAKTWCSCRHVSKRSRPACNNAATLPDLPRLEYSQFTSVPGETGRPTQELMIEGRTEGWASAAAYRDGIGCMLTTNRAYRVAE
jgi:CubicO group peptidase (beta-lactamase class C family)